jgi:hypothetical protein
MNRRLILLNAVLVAVLVSAAYQWRGEYLAAKAREQKTRTAKVGASPVPPFVPLQKQPPVLATGYNEVAQKLLLHPSRNPDLPPPPVEVAPPPPPMPALPRYRGLMNLDGVPVAILVEKENAPFQEVKAGEMIGEFKLISVNTRDITFEWRGQQVRKTLNEALDRTAAEAAPAGNATPANNAPPPPPQVKSQIGPAAATDQFGNKSCDINDTYAPGSVVNGWRKTIVSTPFGGACRWEPVGK